MENEAEKRNEERELPEREEDASEKRRYPIYLIVALVISLASTLVFAGYAGFQTGRLHILQEKTQFLSEGKKGSKDLAYYKERYQKVDELREYVKENYYKEVSDEEIDEWILRGLFLALDDPYSSYFNAQEYQSFMEMNEGAYGGLGITITPAKNGFITVIGTFEDTPASRAGIKQDDKIIKVDGVEYSAEKMDVAVSKMKGEPGTKVKLVILRGEDEIELELERAMIVIDSVTGEILQENPKIAYIRIRSFDQKVSHEFIDHYKELLNQGMEGFVLDLRGNPGGSLSECIDLSDFLLGKQRIVSTKGRKGESVNFDSDAKKVKLPYVLLIDGGSASASEILAAAVQDGGAAKLVGTKSFGKGVVQTLSPPLKDGSGFKITTSEYYTPNGKSIHEKGVEPDITVELSKDYKASDKSTDNQLNEAIKILKQELEKKR